jgi:hypothetical protein
MLTPYVRVSTYKIAWGTARKLALRLLALSFPLAPTSLLLSLSDQQCSVALVLLSLMRVSPWSFPEQPAELLSKLAQGLQQIGLVACISGLPGPVCHPRPRGYPGRSPVGQPVT